MLFLLILGHFWCSVLLSGSLMEGVHIKLLVVFTTKTKGGSGSLLIIL